jgi:hypothetical protein
MEHGEEFDEDFKTSIQMQLESKTSSKIGKRKIGIQTYNDLNGEEFILNNNGSCYKEEWVKKHSFQV